MAGAMGLLAQGELVFNSDIPGTSAGVDIVFHVWSPQVANPSVEATGNSSVPYSGTLRSGDFPTGTQTYTGTLIGGNTVGTGPTGWANGNNYSVDVVAAPGDNAPVSSLVLVAGSLTTFKTSANGAGFNVVPAADLSIPGTTFSGSGISAPTSASLAIQAWYSGGTAFPTYASAVAAGMPYGQGAEFNVDGLGGGSITPPNIANAQSFSLINPIPEPGTIALGVMGACAFLARRRKK